MTSSFALAVLSGTGFATSSIIIKFAVDTSNQHWLLGGFGCLILSYLPMMSLLSQSMSSALVLSGIVSQFLVLCWAFIVLGEPLTQARMFGLTMIAGATIAFNWPLPPAMIKG